MNNWFIWALFSALFAALTAILAKVGVADVNPNLATAIRTTVILVITWAIAFATSGNADWAGLTHRAWIFLAASGGDDRPFVALLFPRAEAGRCREGRAGPDKLSVAIAIILAVIFLGERVRTQEAIGAALIVLAWS